MKKLVCLVLTVMLVLSAFSAFAEQDISQSDIMGNYVEKDSGIFFRVEDEYVYWTTSPAKFWSEPLESGHGYKIEGNQLTTPSSEEGWDSFEMIPYGTGYCLSNSIYTFLPSDDYYSFEHTTINTMANKASGDGFSVSFLNLEYIENIDILEYVTDKWVNSYKDNFILEAPDGMCFVKMQIKLENEGKESIAANDNLSVSVVYDNSYVFRCYETIGNALISEPMNYCYIQGNSSALSAGEINISPLSSKTLTIYMICPSALRDNADKPLCAAFSVKGKNGVPTVVVFDLRSGNL